MRKAKYVWIFWFLLTIFGLFAVYSTSIRKSFNQGSKVTIVQNIDTVKAFDTLLSETIDQKTTEVINTTGAQVFFTPPTIWTGEKIQVTSGGNVVQDADPNAIQIIMPSEELTKLEKDDTESKLVSTKTKIVKTQDNYKYFSNQVRSQSWKLLKRLVILVKFLLLLM